MGKLSTQYMGLSLRSPYVASSSGLTEKVASLVDSTKLALARWC